MKKGIALLLVLIIAFGIYWFKVRNNGSSAPEVKPVPIKVKKHSDRFNNQVDNVVKSYIALKDAFVEADTAAIKKNTSTFIVALDSIQVDELKNDNAAIVATAQSNIADIRSNAVSLLSQNDITEMRQDFRMVTEMMYPAFFKTINYEGPSLYLQSCPMAFGEDKTGTWISNNVEVVNPYLGKNHPEYKGSMLHCGEIKDTIKAQP